MSERSFDGPSHFLPPGHLLTQLHVRRFKQKLVASVTDRRDVYHQAAVTPERSRTNMLPFSFSPAEVDGLLGFQRYRQPVSCTPARGREIEGDKLGFEKPAKASSYENSKVFPTFSSLFQGDRLGVEFALTLLEDAGLLAHDEQVLGHHGFPKGPHYSGLVIDDFFFIGREHVYTMPLQTAAAKALSEARRVYAAEGLLGSDEKDVVSSSVFKAAGAEVNSSPFAVKAGCVTAGAPVGKRRAMATLSLRAACLPGITPTLASRLAGSWTSYLMFRRCLCSVVDGLSVVSRSLSRLSCLCPEASVVS